MYARKYVCKAGREYVRTYVRVRACVRAYVRTCMYVGRSGLGQCVPTEFWEWEVLQVVQALPPSTET